MGVRFASAIVRACSVRSTVSRGAHGPADHGARVAVEHHGEIEPALRGPDVGEVPGPHPVWLLNRELVIEGVFCHGQPVIRRGGGSPLLHGLGPDPFDAHEPRDAVLTNPVPSLEVSRDSRWTTRMAESRARLCTDRSLSGRPAQA